WPFPRSSLRAIDHGQLEENTREEPEVQIEGIEVEVLRLDCVCDSPDHQAEDRAGHGDQPRITKPAADPKPAHDDAAENGSDQRQADDAQLQDRFGQITLLPTSRGGEGP